MCCIDEKLWTGMPESQQNAIMREYDVWARDVVNSGRYRTGAKLGPSSSATTIRARNGKPVTTDGPFAETKEQIGGFHLLECADLDEAISIAKRIPTLKVGGTIEVRPLALDE